MILTFKEALRKSENYPSNQKNAKPHLLLGNGFSISFSPTIFSYDNLLKQADLQNAFEKLSPAVRKIFNMLNTYDFEAVIKLLKEGSQILELYENMDSDLLKTIKSDAEVLKNILVETISKNHPENPSEVRDEQYQACWTFLSNFQTIYSLNYDLLLYWTIIHNMNGIRFNDGFEDPVSSSLYEEDYYEEDYVKWSIGNETSAEVFFMHGGLHLYDAGIETRKCCWSRTGIRLKEQILSAMKKEMYPLFVAEGSHTEKFTKINHNSYLTRCYRSFQSKGGALFIFGLGMKQNDDHVCEAIIEGNYKALFVSLYGDPNSNTNKEILEKLSYIASSRMRKEREKEKNSRRKYKVKELDIYTFQAETAQVWG